MHTSRAFLVLCSVGAMLALAAPGCTGSTPGNGGNPGGGNPGGGNPGGGNPGGGNPDGGPGGGNPDGGPGGGTDGGSVLACIQPGASCVSGTPCCSGICDGTVCAVAQFCQAPGASCTTNTDCCLNSCVNGTCSDQICKDVGKSCGSGNECCTGTCTSGTCAALPVPTGGSSCNVSGQACTSGSQCCSTNCQSGFCGPAYSCQAIGDICRSNDECCGQSCSANNDGGVGRCVRPSGTGGGNCTQAGEPCSGGSNCCSRFCTDPGSGTTVCQAAEGCRLTGTWCTSTASCCGGGDPTSNVTCTGICNNGNACAPSGNICGAPVVPLPDGGFTSINANQDCCNGKVTSSGQITPGKDVCKLDSSGIPRCYGGISAPDGGNPGCPTGYTGQPGCCVAAGNECNFKDECCNGAACLPDQNGVTRCATPSSCLTAGTTCVPGANSNCCSGTTCGLTDTGYACQTPPAGGGSDAGTPDAGTPDAGACNANLQSCTSNTDCCSQLCIGDTSKVCQPPAACQPQGSACTSTADCCTGFSCSIPTGSTTGTCQTSSCTGAGQACTTNGQCCNGLPCVDPTTNYYCSGAGNCTCRAILN